MRSFTVGASRSKRSAWVESQTKPGFKNKQTNRKHEQFEQTNMLKTNCKQTKRSTLSATDLDKPYFMIEKSFIMATTVVTRKPVN